MFDRILALLVLALVLGVPLGLIFLVLGTIFLGLATGAVSVLSDGFHSLTDTASNVVGIIGVRAASAPPDVDHPYGHRKFETMASVGILIFLLLVLREVLGTAWQRFHTGGEPTITALTFGVMAATFLINLAVVIYERRAGHRLRSEILLADAHHTTSDLFNCGGCGKACAPVFHQIATATASYLGLRPSLLGTNGVVLNLDSTALVPH